MYVRGYSFSSDFVDRCHQGHEAKNCYLLVGFPAAEWQTERWSTNAGFGGRRGRGQLNRERGRDKTGYGCGMSTSFPSAQQWSVPSPTSSGWAAATIARRAEEMAAATILQKGAELCSPGRGASRRVADLHNIAEQEGLARAVVTSSVGTPSSVGIPCLSPAQWTSFLNLLNNQQQNTPPSSEDTLSGKIEKD
ncbi:hypothetical protein M9H77_01796 [Catharanthus roseus]|uniref:Uncharacterized protein n=1 Tax=Catharanthus roseus TaxID=4058 RepID=A0ACC0C6K3_CATRO|nr:hypothetical protein M9H77_01796 [Catharanthus roseus]